MIPTPYRAKQYLAGLISDTPFVIACILIFLIGVFIFPHMDLGSMLVCLAIAICSTVVGERNMLVRLERMELDGKIKWIK